MSMVNVVSSERESRSLDPFHLCVCLLQRAHNNKDNDADDFEIRSICDEEKCALKRHKTKERPNEREREKQKQTWENGRKSAQIKKNVRDMTDENDSNKRLK